MPNEHKLTVLLSASEATPEDKESLRQSFKGSANGGSTLMWTLSGLVLAACGGGAGSTTPNHVVVRSEMIQNGAEVVTYGREGAVGGATVTTDQIVGSSGTGTTVENGVASVGVEHREASIAVQVPQGSSSEVAVGGASPESSVYRPRMGDDATDGGVFITPLTELLWNTQVEQQQRVLDNIFGGAVSVNDILNGSNYQDASQYRTGNLVSELITQASLAVMAIKNDNSLGNNLDDNHGASPGEQSRGNGRGDEPEGPNTYITKLQNLFAGFRARHQDNDANNDGLTLNGGSLKDAVVEKISGVTTNEFTITVTDGAVLGATVYSDTDADGVLDVLGEGENPRSGLDEDLTFFTSPTDTQAQVQTRTDDHGQIEIASSFPYDTAPFIARIEGTLNVPTSATLTGQAWRSFYVRQGDQESDRDQLDDGNVIISPLTDLLSRLAADSGSHQNIQLYLDNIFGGVGIITIGDVLNIDNYDIDSTSSVAVLITTASLALTEIARTPALATGIAGLDQDDINAINAAPAGHQKNYLTLQQLFSKTSIQHDNPFTGENLRAVIASTSPSEQNEGALLANVLARLNGLFGYTPEASSPTPVGKPLAGNVYIGAVEHDSDRSNDNNGLIDEVIFDFGAYLVTGDTQTEAEYYEAAARLFGFADPYGNFDNNGDQIGTPSTDSNGGYDTFEGILITSQPSPDVRIYYRENNALTLLNADKPNHPTDDPAPAKPSTPGFDYWYVSLENIRNLVIVTDSDINTENGGIFEFSYLVWDGDEFSSTHAPATISLRIGALNDGIIKNPDIGEVGGDHLKTDLSATEGGSTNSFFLEGIPNPATPTQLDSFFYDPIEGDDVFYRARLIDDEDGEVALHSWISVNRNTGTITVRGDGAQAGVYTIRVFATDGIPNSGDPADITELQQDFTLTVHNTGNYRPQIITNLDSISEAELPRSMTRLTEQPQTTFELESRGGAHGNYFTDRDIGTFMIEGAETTGVELFSDFTHRIAVVDDMDTDDDSDDVTYGYLYFNADGTNGGFAGDYHFDITPDGATAINDLDSGENPRISFNVVNNHEETENRLPIDDRYEITDTFTIQIRGATGEGGVSAVAATSAGSAHITITDTSAVDTASDFQTPQLNGRFSSIDGFNVLEDLSYEMVVLDSEDMDITATATHVDTGWLSIDADTGTITFAEDIPNEVAGNTAGQGGRYESTYTLRVTARDELGVPTEPLDFALTVRDNRAPEINELFREDYLPERIARITTNGEFALEGRGPQNLNYFSDPDSLNGDIASYSLERVVGGTPQAAPSWISIDNNGLITLTNGVKGNYVIRVTATDNGDGAGEGYGAESAYIDFALEVI